MRYLRKKYGEDKKVFVALRATYLALCEMESDFGSSSVTGFNKTVGTYAGLSRQVAGKYIRLLEEEGLIEKVRNIDTKTNLKSSGTYLKIKSSDEFLDRVEESEKITPKKNKPNNTPSLRVAGYPTIRTSDHSDTPPVLRKISVTKKIINNVNQKLLKQENDKADYYADLIAEKLGDVKSLTYFKLACRKYQPELLLQRATEIIADGGAKNAGAVFVDWMKKNPPQATQEPPA